MPPAPAALSSRARAARLARRIYLGPPAQTNRVRRGVRAGLLGLLTLSVLSAAFPEPPSATRLAGHASPAAAADAPGASPAAEPAPPAAVQVTASRGPAAPPTTAETTAETAAETAAETEPGTALAALATVAVKGRAPRTGYERDRFGPAWADTDRNGCDTRNDVLSRDLTAETFKAGTNNCVVITGRLLDPYTGRTLGFRKDDASAVQIDHVVSLSNAWQTGAQGWTADKRLAFANDPLNLLAVDGPTNGSKGDGDAATWLPPNKGYRCAMVARQVAVKAKYQLWMTPAERDASARVLSACPRELAPTGGNPTTAPLPRPRKPPPPPPPPPATKAPTKAPAAPPAANPAPAPGRATPPAASSDQGTVHPGAFCSPSGATGRTSKGTAMVCGPTAKSPNRARWHAA
jgi:hypothetical protein